MRQKNGIALYVVIALSVLLTLAYDTFQPRSIETVAVISGVGIEAGEQKKIKVSVQIMKPDSNGNTEGNTASSVLMSAEGDNVTQACEGLVAKVGGVLFWSHCAVIIIDKSFAAENDMVVCLDYFFRSSNFRNTSAVIVYDGSPAEVFNSDTVSETVSAFGIRKMMDDQGYESNCVYTTLKRFVKDYYSLSQSSLVQSVTVAKAESTDKSSGQEKESGGEMAALGKGAVFYKGKYVADIDEDTFNGYEWLTDTMMARTITLEDIVLKSEGDMENTIGFKIFGTNTTLKPTYENGKYALRVKIAASAEIISVENAFQAVGISSDRLNRRYDELASKLGDKIKNDINMAFESMRELNCDYCGTEDTMYSYLGKKWDKSSQRTVNEMLDEINIEYEIKITVISGGLNKRYELNSQ